MKEKIQKNMSDETVKETKYVHFLKNFHYHDLRYTRLKKME